MSALAMPTAKPRIRSSRSTCFTSGRWAQASATACSGEHVHVEVLAGGRWARSAADGPHEHGVQSAAAQLRQALLAQSCCARAFSRSTSKRSTSRSVATPAARRFRVVSSCISFCVTACFATRTRSMLST